MGNSGNDWFEIASLYSSFCSSSFLNLIIDGLIFDDKLFSANKFTNASALSCPLGKSCLVLAKQQTQGPTQRP